MSASPSSASSTVTTAGSSVPSFEVAAVCSGLHVPVPRPAEDAWIAATALVHGLVVVTRNVADFEGMGVELLDPWEPTR